MRPTFITRIFAVCMAILLVSSTIVTTIVLLISTHAITDEIEFSSEALSEIYISEISKLLDRMYRISLMATTNIDVETALKRNPLTTSNYEQYLDMSKCNRYFVQLTATEPQISSLVIHINPAKYYANNRPFFRSIEDTQGQAWYQELREKEELWMIETIERDTFPSTSYQALTYHKLLSYDQGGRDDIVVSVSVNTNSIINIFELLSRYEEPFFQIQNQQTNVLEYQMPAIPASELSNGLNRTPGARYFVARYKLSIPGWSMLFGFRVDNKFESNTSLIFTALGTTLLVALFAFALCCFFWRRSTRRVERTLHYISSPTNQPYLLCKSRDEFDTIDQAIARYREEISHLLTEQYNAGMEIKSLELKALRNAIDPHFLYNTLDIINWSAINNGAPEVAVIVRYLARFYKLSLNHGMDISTLDTQLEHLKSYLEIQKIRLENTIDYQFAVALGVGEFILPHLILQPIVENSLLHGMHNMDIPGEIHVTAKKDEHGNLTIDIIDNGCGVPKAFVGAEISHLDLGVGGYGIKSVDTRIRNFFGAGSGLFYLPTTTGTHARIIVNQQTDKSASS